MTAFDSPFSAAQLATTIARYELPMNVPNNSSGGSVHSACMMHGLYAWTHARRSAHSLMAPLAERNHHVWYHHERRT